MGIKLERINEREYKLLEDVTIVNHTILKGFKTDGASIPRAFWWLIGSPFTGKYVEAALLHDALYASEFYDRELCDFIFLSEMQNQGVSWWRADLMYWAVRIGGYFVWKKHTKQSVAKAKLYVEFLK